MKLANLAPSRERVVDSVEELRDAVRADFETSHFASTLPAITLNDDGTIEFNGQRLPYTDAVHDKIVSLSGIPRMFDEDIPPDLLMELFEKRKRDKACPVTICTSNETVVGIGPPHYMHESSSNGLVKTLDLLDHINLTEGYWEFDSAVVADEGVKINLLIPGATIEPDKDDVIKVGLELTNSETGGSALKSDLYSLRLVCTNGMTRRLNETSVYYTKLGSMSGRSKLRLFARQFDESRSRVAESARTLYEGVSDAVMLDADLLSLHRSLKRRIGGAKIDADQVLGIPRQSRIEIANQVKARGRRRLPEPTDYSCFEVHNSITATARTQRLRLRRSLEQLGGNVLLMGHHPDAGQSTGLIVTS